MCTQPALSPIVGKLTMLGDLWESKGGVERWVGSVPYSTSYQQGVALNRTLVQSLMFSPVFQDSESEEILNSHDYNKRWLGGAPSPCKFHLLHSHE